jgi:anti-anti-sigma regulatory factor
MSSEGRAAGHTSSEMLVVTRTASRFESSVTVNHGGRPSRWVTTFGEMQDVLSRVMAEATGLSLPISPSASTCDHSGLGVLVNAHVALTGKNGAACDLVGLSPQLKDAMRLLRLDDVLSLAADEKTAVLELARSSGPEPMPTPKDDVTRCYGRGAMAINSAERPDARRLHREVRKLARSYLRRERPDHTLQPTALVNEAYLRLIDQRQVRWNNPRAFFWHRRAT